MCEDILVNQTRTPLNTKSSINLNQSGFTVNLRPIYKVVYSYNPGLALRFTDFTPLSSEVVYVLKKNQ